MNSHFLPITLGTCKIFLDRLHGYVGKLQFFMVAWLFFQTVHWPWWAFLYIVWLFEQLFKPTGKGGTHD